jgi:hypothetical protein
MQNSEGDKGQVDKDQTLTPSVEMNYAVKVKCNLVKVIFAFLICGD